MAKTYCSYPTYEEWKLSIVLPSIPAVGGSYPTYEEWKLEEILEPHELVKVLILPMRNGNGILAQMYL